MSLFKFVYFFSLSFMVSNPAMSTARLTQPTTQSCVTLRLPPVNQLPSNMRLHNAPPSQEGVVSRTQTYTFPALPAQNGKHLRSTFLPVSDTRNPTSMFRCFYLSSPPGEQPRRFVALLAPRSAPGATSHHSRGIRRRKRRFSHVCARYSPAVQVQHSENTTLTLPFPSCDCSRMRTCEGLVRKSTRFHSAVEKLSFVAWKGLSLSSDKVCATSPVGGRELFSKHIRHQAQTGKDNCESFFYQGVYFRSLPETLRPSKYVSSISRGNSVTRQNPLSSAAVSNYAFTAASSSKSTPSNHVASSARASPQTSSLHAAWSPTLVSPSSSPRLPQPSNHLHIRTPSLSRSAHSAGPTSSSLISSHRTVRSTDSSVPASGLGSAEASKAPSWPPWLPYGLPPEGMLPRPIAESTSAASLQYAKKVFLDLLQSGRLTRCPAPAHSVVASSAALASQTQAGAAGEARRRGEDQETAGGTGGVNLGEEPLAAGAEQTSAEIGIAASGGGGAFASVDPSGGVKTAVTPAAAECADPPLGEEQVRIFAVFTEKYVEEVALSGRLTAQALFNILASTWQLAWKYSNYPFTPYHKALRAPLDFSAWSEMMWRPLIDLSRSKIVLPVPERSSNSVSSSFSFDPSSSSTSPCRSSPDASPASPSSSVSAASPGTSPPSPFLLPLSSPPTPSSPPFAGAVDAWSLGGEVTPAAAAVAGAADGVSPLQMIKDKLERAENVIFLSNHQTEPDPQVLKLVFEHLGERELGQRIIFVAGHKVREDPVSTPFSLGCNLLCVHSKKHLTSALLSVAEQHRRQQRNVAAMAALQQMLEEGGTLVWVAPSGGRDRQDETGQFSKPDKFDPKAVRLFRLLAKKANATKGRVTHFCPMAFYTAPICPPPKKVEGRLGEHRTCAFSPVGVGIGNFLPNDESCTHEAFAEKAEAETWRLYDLIKP